MWLGTGLATQAVLLRRGGRSQDPGRQLGARRAVQPWLAVEHAALALALLSGLVLMAVRGWGVGYPRWLAVKLGLVAFLLVPLEAMHAWVSHAWIARGLVETSGAPFTTRLRRGIGMDEMVRTLAAVLLTAAVPVIAWLSFGKPF